MQSAGNLVSPAAEFTAGMQDRKYYLNRRNTGFLLNVYRNTAAVVLYRDRIILIYLYFNRITETGKRFIHGIINDLIHEVMEASHGSTSNIHTRTFPYRL